MRPFYLFILLLFLFILSCEESPDEEQFEEKLVVTGYLIAGHGIDSVIVSKTVDITQPYDEETMVSHAQVIVTHSGQFYSLDPVPQKPGYYSLPPESLIIEIGETYDLHVNTGELSVQANTTVPDSISIWGMWIPDPDSLYKTKNGPLPDTVVWNNVPFNMFNVPAFALIWDSTEVMGDIYRVVVKVENPDLSQLIDQSDYPEGLKDSSEWIPQITEGGAEGFGWWYLNYYGWHTIEVYSFDEAYYDFHLGNIYDEWDDPRSNIEGGYGLWASASMDSIKIYLKRP